MGAALGVVEGGSNPERGHISRGERRKPLDGRDIYSYKTAIFSKLITTKQY